MKESDSGEREWWGKIYFVRVLGGVFGYIFFIEIKVI